MPRRLVLVFIVTLIADASAALAQSTSSGFVIARPYRGLFGPGVREERRRPRLTLSLSVYSGRDDTSQFASGGVADEALQMGRMHEGAQAVVMFARRRSRSVMSIDMASAVRYYSSLHRIGTQKHHAGFELAVRSTQRLTVQLAQRVGYSPTYQLTLGPSPAPVEANGPALTTADIDYSVSREKLITYGSLAGGTYSWSRGRQLTFGYSLSYANFFNAADYSLQQGGAAYTHPLASDIGLRLGYRFGRALLAGEPSSRNHDLDVGLSYSRALAFSPRSSLALTSGSSAISTSSGRQFALTGGVQLKRLLSPRWTADVGYQRGLQAIDRVPRPFIADTVIGQISGFFNSRTSLRLAPSHTRGVDVVDPSREYRSTTSQARLDVAVSRHWAVYVEHFYFRYRFTSRPDLPAALAAGLNRQGLRMGLALWAPLIR